MIKYIKNFMLGVVLFIGSVYYIYKNGKQAAKKEMHIDGLNDTIIAHKGREVINNEIRKESDIVDRANRIGIVRK